ncbi:MAG: EAL domain-containing protein [Nitrospinae bacterium]|nr:EAL domain-containing protein [Nitrospinota bacterium]
MKKPRLPAHKADDKKSVDPNNLYYVGIGSSAGGLEALRTFVAHLPSKSNLTYIIAQHMSPDHRSMMVELLGRETTIRVTEAKNNILPEADTVYVAPPSSDITIRDGYLKLSKPKAAIGPKPSVDMLFMSLAEDRGEKAIGIVFSGTGSDGSHGIKAIRSVGGISIAQEPSTAKYDSMPKAAIRSGGIDIVLPPKECAEQLILLSTRPRVQLDEERDEPGPTSVRGIIRQISSHTGMDFSNYKDATISRQIQRRMAALQIPDLDSYGEYLAVHTDEYLEVANSFLICVTSFFRDTESFEAMRKTLGELLKRKEPGDAIRVWVPGCATGEEAYSIAIIIAEELGANFDKYRVQIFGTDINDVATTFARRGLYPEAALAEMDDKLLRKYFTQQDRMYHVKREIKDTTVFARQDLVQDPPFVKIDMVSCRNLLIYFKTELQEKVLRLFHYSLVSQGVLFLGKSESLGQSANFFREKGRKHKIFVRRDVPTPPPGNFGRALPLERPKRIEAHEAENQTPADRGRARLFDLYSPASVLVTAEGDVLEIFGDFTPFMKLKKGKADFNLFTIIHPAFRPELRAFIHRVSRDKGSAYGQPVTVKVEGDDHLHRMAVHYVGNDNLDRELLTVCFEKMPERQHAIDGSAVGLEESVISRITELEHELTSTRENLQTVVEELETSNEELQALNEEAQAANEELQASNEELETSNEELQATNEELTTVNDELLTKTTELSHANNDLENVLNNILRALVVVDQKLLVTRFNDLATHFFGFHQDGLLSNLSSVPVHFPMPDLLTLVKGVINSGDTAEREFSYESRHYILTVSPYLEGGSREVSGAILTFHDITDRKNAEERLKLSATVFEAASEATLITDQDNFILSVNPAFERITGYSSADVIGHNPSVLASGKHGKPFYREMWKTLLDTGHWQGEIWNKRKSGEVYPEWLSLSLLRDDKGKVIRHIALFSDITDDKKAEEIIRQQANFDTLTGLANRNLFFNHLQQAIATANRYRRILGLLFIDLDGFKGVNDTLGHAIGDKVLREVAARLLRTVRETDLVARLGGDEFTVLIREMVSATDASPVSDKILDALSQPFMIDHHTIHLSASIGVTLFPEDGLNIETLLKNADSAMYSAKSAGRNTSRYFTKDLQEAAERYHRLTNDMRNALLNEEFSVVYQPIVDLHARTIVGAEALLRWEHPKVGFIPPLEFIAVAEETGLIGELGAFVAKTACQAALEWQGSGRPIHLAINKSPKEFAIDDGFAKWRSHVIESGLPKDRVVVEITENVRLIENNLYQSLLAEMRTKGYRVSLDDFGTGYSSLGYLRRLPVDTVKIDRSFVGDLNGGGDNDTLVEVILAIARRFHMQVVAEGVETKAQRDFLMQGGCHFAQGYFFSRPVSHDAFLKLLGDTPTAWWE